MVTASLYDGFITFCMPDSIDVSTPNGGEDHRKVMRKVGIQYEDKT